MDTNATTTPADEYANTVAAGRQRVADALTSLEEGRKTAPLGVARRWVERVARGGGENAARAQAMLDSEDERRRAQYAEYRDEEWALASVMVWPSCHVCDSGPTRPCDADCLTIEHIYT